MQEQEEFKTLEVIIMQNKEGVLNKILYPQVLLFSCVYKII